MTPEPGDTGPEDAADTAPGWRLGEEPRRLGQPGPSWAGTARPTAEHGTDHGAESAAARREAAAGVSLPSAEGAPTTTADEAALAARPAAPFWRRAVGYALDVVVLMVLLTLVTVATRVDFEGAADGDLAAQNDVERLYLVILALRVVYYWIWNTLGWSPGKRMVGLRLIREDGSAPGIGPGFARTVVSLISDLALGIGYVWAAWDRRGQTWHDKMAGTRVVQVGLHEDLEDIERRADRAR